MIIKRKWIPVLAVVLILPLLISLGFWQLRRAEEKTVLQAEYDARARHEPLRIGTRLMDVEVLRFYPVVADGIYDASRQFLVDNRIHNGQAGYHVITPLIVEGGETRVLVNRGWVPAGADRARIPDVKPPAGRVRVQGLAIVPLKGGVQLGTWDMTDGVWQQIWPRLDIEHFVAVTRFSVQPIAILLGPESDAGGYVREWKRLDTGIAVHQGYAFQWFSLALALLTISLFLGLRRKTGNQTSE